MFAYFGKKQPLEDNQSESDPASEYANISENGKKQACGVATPSKTKPNTISSEKIAMPSKVGVMTKTGSKSSSGFNMMNIRAGCFVKTVKKAEKEIP